MLQTINYYENDYIDCHEYRHINTLTKIHKN